MFVFFIQSCLFSQEHTLFNVSLNESFGSYTIEILNTPGTFIKHKIIFSYEIDKQKIKTIQLTLPLEKNKQKAIQIRDVYFSDNEMVRFDTNLGVFSFPIAIVRPNFYDIRRHYRRPHKI